MDFLLLLGYLNGVEEWRRRDFSRFSKAKYDPKQGESHFLEILRCFFPSNCSFLFPLQLVRKDIARINYSSSSKHWFIVTPLKCAKTSPFSSSSCVPLWQGLRTGFTMFAQHCIRLSPCTYLDHAGCPLYPESLIRKFMGFLLQSTIGNPHSGVYAPQWIDLIKAQLLDFLGGNSIEYSLIFTAGATDALRLLAESFPFENESVFAYNSDCHTSLLGMRAIAMQKGASIWSIPLQLGSTDAGWGALNGIEPISLNCVASTGVTNFFLCSSLSPDDASSVIANPFNRVNSNFNTESRMACSSSSADMQMISHHTLCFRHPESMSLSLEGQTSLHQQEHSLASAIFPPDSNKENNIRKLMHFPTISSNKNLLALTGESNLSGERPDLNTLKNLINTRFSTVSSDNATNEGPSPIRKWWVLLDAAKLASSFPLDLSILPVDFMVVSMYKIFGYPTGLGALLVHHSSSSLLRHHYFGGGTALAMSAFSDFFVPKQDLVGSLEMGTPNFQAILSIPFAIDEIYGKTFSRKQLYNHTMAVTRYAYLRMIALRHPPLDTGEHWALISSGTKSKNFQEGKKLFSRRFSSVNDALKGVNLCTVFGKHASSRWRDFQGPTIAFILHYIDGSVIPHSFIVLRATYWNIRLRVGCHCNIGGCQENLHLTDKQMRVHYEMGHVCGDSKDILNGIPTGCVRVSFGFSSIKKDVDRFILFLVCEFLGRSSPETMAVLPSLDTLERESSVATVVTSATAKQRAMEVLTNQCSELINSIHDGSSSISFEREMIIKEGDNRIENILSVETFKDNLVANPTMEQKSKGRLRSITIYPLKGCAGISIMSWLLDTRSSCLLWDRQYCLMEHCKEDGMRLISKRAIPALTRIRTDIYLPVIDSEQGLSTIFSYADNVIPLLLLSVECLPASGDPLIPSAESHTWYNSPTPVAPLALPLCSPLEWQDFVSVIKDAAQLLNGGYKPSAEQLLSWMPPILHSAPFSLRSTSLESTETLKSCLICQKSFYGISSISNTDILSIPSHRENPSIILNPGPPSNPSGNYFHYNYKSTKESGDAVPLAMISSSNARKTGVWLLPKSRINVHFVRSHSFDSRVATSSKESKVEAGFPAWYCKGSLGDVRLFGNEPTVWWMSTSALNVCMRASFSFAAPSDVVLLSCNQQLILSKSCIPFVNQAPLLLLNASTVDAIQRYFSFPLEIERFADSLLDLMSLSFSERYTKKTFCFEVEEKIFLTCLLHCIIGFKNDKGRIQGIRRRDLAFG
ncbi:aminotransferase, class V family protein [Cardiosporidium cionae]|uniref:Aminotransferase, class V family protein n=1 Tax=Cardiosporidium cionae TaxID=476202 RepID=A0ABQ7J3Z6_9APIC|nr:aminotransferase, class V family protein [Cardiosporidium cionae]|eukprot:KAF8817837.1 aminotransferase, class V family protein [Cardiosporidium cionae]